MLSNGSVCCCCCSRYTDNFLYNVMKLHPTGLELLFGWSVMNPLVQIIHKILQRISQHQSCSYFIFVSWDHSILLTFWVTSCISIMYMYLYIDVCRCIFFFLQYGSVHVRVTLVCMFIRNIASLAEGDVCRITSTPVWWSDFGFGFDKTASCLACCTMLYLPVL